MVILDGSGRLPATIGVPASDIVGTVPTSNGGTGSSSAANSANGVVVLDSSGRLPAVSGALLTSVPQPFSSKNVVTGSRSPNTNYTNSTGKTMMVTASMTINPTGGGIDVYTGGVKIQSYSPYGTAGTVIVVTFLVLSGETYNIAPSYAPQAVPYWIEWY